MSKEAKNLAQAAAIGATGLTFWYVAHLNKQRRQAKKAQKRLVHHH